MGIVFVLRLSQKCFEKRSENARALPQPPFKLGDRPRFNGERALMETDAVARIGSSIARSTNEDLSKDGGYFAINGDAFSGAGGRI